MVKNCYETCPKCGEIGWCSYKGKARIFKSGPGSDLYKVSLFRCRNCGKKFGFELEDSVPKSKMKDKSHEKANYFSSDAIKKNQDDYMQVDEKTNDFMYDVIEKLKDSHLYDMLEKLQNDYEKEDKKEDDVWEIITEALEEAHENLNLASPANHVDVFTAKLGIERALDIAKKHC